MSLKDRIKKAIGPGVITGIADDDPSGIATYAQTGAIFGLTQLWLALYCIPFMVTIQEMCGRIGMVTGKGLAGVIKSHYSKKILYLSVVLLFIANTINIGADLGAMAEATRLVTPIPFGITLFLFTLFTILTTVFIPYKIYVKILKWLALSIAAYIVTAFTINHVWTDIFRALFIPRIMWTQEYLLNVTAMLGTTISPYLFFWQASEEVEEEIVDGKIRYFGRGTPKITKNDLLQMRTDTLIGMTTSNIVTFFVIITASSTLYGTGVTGVASAAQMASALEPLAGSFATLLFALGIIGTGLLAIPTLAGSAGYALAEAASFEEGLSKRFSQAKGFYLVIILSLLAGAMVNFLGIDPMAMLYYAAVVNGVLAAPLMIIILLVANNKKILKDQTNSILSNIFGIAITGAMCIAGILTILSFF